jgi:glycosyltransferase involved in cell wall biosynthesis
MLAKKRTEEIQDWCQRLDAECIMRKRYRNPLSFFSEFKFIYRLRKLKADKVWFNTLNLYQIIVVRLLIKNSIISIHDVEFHPTSKDYFSLLSHKLTILFFKRRICTFSKSQAEIFRYRYGIEPKIMQLPVIDYYARVSEHDAINETEFDGKLFFFGSVSEYKGIETLLSAAKILTDRKLNFQLNIYGRIQYKIKEMRSGEVNQINTNFFDQYVSYKQVHKIFLENSLLIVPYRQVTQCGPLLIAYCARVPVICSDLPGFREYVDNGESGFLFNNTPEDLAAKIEFLLAHPQKMVEMKSYIGNKIMKRYSMQNLVDSYLDILRQ